VNNNDFDVYMMALFGALGYVWVKLECEPAPLILGFILGPMMEENLRRAMLLARGNPIVFIEKPISLGLLAAAALLLLVIAAPMIRRRREEAFQEA
jgi:putative tricarboxylic transport membrane protein